MTAAYDSFDYPSYWLEREYEHESEKLAIRAFLAKIKKIGTVLDIGAGYGRLTPSYIYRAKKIIFSDPSSKQLKMAKSQLKNRKITFIQSKLENIEGKVKNKSVDLIIMIRVLHHIKNCNQSFNLINKLLCDNGYLILEFPNKQHFKATVYEFFKGNFTFPIEIFPKDLRSKKAKIKKVLPFINYHPDDVFKKLEESGFKIVEKRSISNVRSPFLKKYIPLEFLLSIERKCQKPLSYTNFGPSIFILARKETI